MHAGGGGRATLVSLRTAGAGGRLKLVALDATLSATGGGTPLVTLGVMLGTTRGGTTLITLGMAGAGGAETFVILAAKPRCNRGRGNTRNAVYIQTICGMLQKAQSSLVAVDCSDCLCGDGIDKEAYRG